MHPFAHVLLLAFQLFLPGALQLTLELLVGGARLQDLLDLALSILNDLICSLFFGLEQLYSVVQPDHIKLDFLSALSDLRH